MLVEYNVMITGECFCGEITYQVSGKLRDAKSCHCSRCRKAFASQASAYAAGFMVTGCNLKNISITDRGSIGAT